MHAHKGRKNTDDIVGGNLRAVWFWTSKQARANVATEQSRVVVCVVHDRRVFVAAVDVCVRVRVRA